MFKNDALAPFIAIHLAFFVTFWCGIETRNDDALPADCGWATASPPPAAAARDSHRPGQTQSELLCRLRTLSRSEGLLEHLSAAQMDAIARLQLECHDAPHAESYLESAATPGRFLGHLSQLQRLSVRHCQIRYMPAMVLAGQKELLELELSAGAAGPGALSLELHAESFRGLSKLQRLNLAQNGMWAVPAGVFCPLHSLRRLNLTGNRLSDVQQLGLSDWGGGPSAPVRQRACNVGLEVLDLSANELAGVADNVFSALRSLTELHLSSNKMRFLADRAFVGLASLKILNVSNNKLTSLPPDVFQSPRRIESIDLHDNLLSVLALGLFEGLDYLEILDLANNQLTSNNFNRDTFAGLRGLVVLNLAFNKLGKIDHFIFRKLQKLRSLNLQHNAIELVPNNVFADLQDLQILTLSGNRIRSIEPHAFSALFALSQLFLESNQIEDIPDRAFENLTKLHDLNLNDNKLRAIPLGMKNLRILLSLDLGKNKIAQINRASFEGLDKLMGLRLIDNYITAIPRDIFYALSSLDVLNLASNQIQHIDERAFASNPTIRAIRLDNNHISDIGTVFKAVTSLIWLNVSDNNIQAFDYSFFPPSLQWLDVHKNNIDAIKNEHNVSSASNLTTLDFSYNFIKYINSNLITNNIETLFLNNNVLNHVAHGSFVNKTNLLKVVLYGNLLTNLDMASIVLTPVPVHRPLPEFFISFNLFDCDCNIEWLQRIQKFNYLRQYPNIVDLDMVECRLKYERDNNNSIHSLLKLKTNDFLCKYDGHCFATCHCCDYDACDCKMTCPDGCSCFYDITWSRNIVDCGMLNITEIPERIPMDATEIYLDGNNFADLDSHIFIGKKKLRKLYLNNSMISTLHNRTFNGLANLEVLHLEENKLGKLNGLEFNQLSNLNELHLEHNDIVTIADDTFNTLNNLEILQINDNKLTDFRPWEQLKSSSDTLNLFTFNNVNTKNNNNNNSSSRNNNYNNKNNNNQNGNINKNKINCNCDNLMKLKKWLVENENKLNLSNNIFVCYNNTYVNDIIKLCEAMSELTPIATPTVQRTLLDTENIMRYLPLFLQILLALIIIIIAIVVVFVFRYNIRLWFHSQYGWRLCSHNDAINDTEKIEDNEKLYDGFIIYSLEDTLFLTQNITTEVEESGYAICLHYRDVHSQTYLIDSLQSAADASRKIIIFVSMNFLQNEWLQPEYKVGLQAVIELIRPARRRNKLIMITTAPHNIIEMDPIMNILMHTCTVIPWNDKMFWKKLRYALPDIVKKRFSHINPSHKATNLRYTPAPTNINTWLRQQHLNPAPTAPRNETPIDEDETQQQFPMQPHHPHSQLPAHKCMQQAHEFKQLQQQKQVMQQSPQYELPMPSQFHHHYYRDKLSTSLSHVYSTIPEPETNPHLHSNMHHHTNTQPHPHAHHPHHHHCSLTPSPTLPPPPIPASAKYVKPKDNRPCFV